MYIGQGVSLEASYAAQAERRAANTAMAQASASAAAAADERASSASPTCLSPTAETDSIASPPPTGASTDSPSGASIADDLTGSLAPLAYVKDFYLCHRPWYWREDIPAKMARLAKSQSPE